MTKRVNLKDKHNDIFWALIFLSTRYFKIIIEKIFRDSTIPFIHAAERQAGDLRIIFF